jgi:hypothetical protein
MTCAHTHFTAGKKVLVTMRDGQKFYDRFEETLSRSVRFRVRGRVSKRTIQSIQIPKGSIYEKV